MSRIIVSGSVAYDRIMDYNGLFSEHILPEKVHSINLSFVIDKLSVQFGGTAGNIAYSLAMLGEQVDLISTVGNDFARYRSHMLLSGVDPTNLKILEDELTATAYIFTDKADNQIAAFHPGAGGAAYDTLVEVDGRAFAIVAPGCIEDMVALPTHYRKYGLKYYYDPGQQTSSLTKEQLLAGIDGCEVFFASDYEYTLVMEKTGLTETGLLEHVPTIVVTLGASGSDIVTRDGRVHIASARIDNPVDPTGAGDAYRAGFAKGVMLGLPMPQCVKLASITASFAVQSYGTQAHKFSLADIAQRYHETYHESIPLG